MVKTIRNEILDVVCLTMKRAHDNYYKISGGDWLTYGAGESFLQAKLIDAFVRVFSAQGIYVCAETPEKEWLQRRKRNLASGKGQRDGARADITLWSGDDLVALVELKLWGEVSKDATRMIAHLKATPDSSTVGVFACFVDGKDRNSLASNIARFRQWVGENYNPQASKEGPLISHKGTEGQHQEGSVMKPLVFLFSAT